MLGDSSTIVTEGDPVYLQDQVPDLQPASEETPEEQPATTPSADTATAPAKPAEQPAAPKPAITGNGLTAAFKEVTVFIPNIVTRSYNRQQDLKNASGATYELTSGNLSGNQLKIASGTVQKVTQRYQTHIILQDGPDKLVLESLGAYSSEWQTLNGSNGAYTIAGLEPSRLQFKDARPAAIRNAVQQAARKARMSRAETDDWVDFARAVKAANQKPCAVVLSSISWRISGKDAAGKAFNKEIRMDMQK